MRVHLCKLVYMRVCVFPLMDCLSERTRSVSYGWLKHLLSSHVRWVWSYLWEALSKYVNPSHPGHFVWGQRFGLWDSLFPHTTSQGVAEAISASILCAIVMSEVICLVPLLWQGINAFVHSHVLPTPLTVMLFIPVWLLCAHRDSYMSTLMVPSCLQEVRHTISSLPHLYTTLTDTHTLFHLLCAAVCHLSFPLFTSSGEGVQTWPACFVMTITSMCHLFSWVLQYLSQSSHSQKLSCNTPSTSSQLEGQKYSLRPHLWHGLWHCHIPNK